MVNIDEKNFKNKVLTHQIQQCIKKKKQYIRTKVDLFQGCKDKHEITD